MTYRVNGHQDLLKITISVADFEELQKFQRGIINLLGKVEIDKCKPEVIEDVKSLYKLLLSLRESMPKQSKVLI